jgi:hypothetical protein
MPGGGAVHSIKSDCLLRCREMTLWAISGREQSQQNNPLFDHVVGAAEYRRRHGEAERPGGLEIDDKIELGGPIKHVILGQPFAVVQSSVPRQSGTAQLGFENPK